MEKTKNNFIDKLTEQVMKISEPLAKLSALSSISAVQDGLVACMPILIIGSIFLILYVLGSPVVGSSGKALLPFLTPYADKFSWVNSLTMGFLGLYCSISIPVSYGEKTGKLDTKTAALLGITTFLLFTLSGNDEAGGISVAAFSASGLFVCIVTSLVSAKLYIFLLEKNIRISMPDSVPPNIGNAFTSLIPYGVCFTLAWFVRSVLNFDMVTWLMGVLSPLVSGSDNVFTLVVVVLITVLLWSVGLHGDNMFLTFMTPFGAIWLNENVEALAAGASVYELPHVLAGIGQTGLVRLTVWTAGVWPLVIFMILSKVKYLKTLGWTCLPSAVFTIVEPVIFGLPLALNPFLIVPFLLSTTLSTVAGYLLMATPLFGKFYALVPWATPPFILGPVGTGDIKTALIPFISMAIGVIIYLPFWRQYEKECMLKENEESSVNDSEQCVRN